MAHKRILVINPGSTSTKIAIFYDEECVNEVGLDHPVSEMSKFPTTFSQLDFRYGVIMNYLKEINFDINLLDACVGRGGYLHPITAGTYTVNDAVSHDLEIALNGDHAANLGGLLARKIADPLGIPSYIVDPTAVDELQDVARISGMPEIKRVSKIHALNMRAVSREYAKSINRHFEDLNLIVAHMGGGCTTGLLAHGKMIDMFNGLDGDGAFAPTRSGAVPVGDLIRLCYSGKYKTVDEMMKRAVGDAGIAAYLGTADMREVDQMIANGDKHAKLIKDAFVYQHSKDIGALATAAHGKVDAIILTGGIAHGKDVTDAITAYVGWIAPVIVIPGEREMIALAQGALRVLNGEEEAKEYVAE
jgi:butyrate kinase